MKGKQKERIKKDAFHHLQYSHNRFWKSSFWNHNTQQKECFVWSINCPQKLANFHSQISKLFLEWSNNFLLFSCVFLFEWRTWNNDSNHNNFRRKFYHDHYMMFCRLMSYKKEKKVLCFWCHIGSKITSIGLNILLIFLLLYASLLHSHSMFQ